MSSFPASLRAFLFRYLVALGVALALTVGGIVAGNLKIDQQYSKIKTTKPLNLPKEPPEAANFLLIGSDSRAFESPGDVAAQQAFGSPQQQTGQRSDTMMIIHVDPNQKKTLLVSIPRDTIVQIPGMGRQKINAAFNRGPQKVIDTINANFDVKIHHYVEVDFKAFKGVVDAIGSVNVYFPAPTRDTFTGLNVWYAGCWPLKGTAALSYVRSRDTQVLIDGKWQNASPRADLDRIQRQQSFIRRLAGVAYREAGSDPFTATAIAGKVAAQLTRDPQFSRGDLLRLANAFRTVDPSSSDAVEMDTLPTKAGDAHGTFLVVDHPAADQVLQRLRTFGPLPGAAKPVHPYETHVEVLNGSGRTGLAAETLATLQDKYQFLPAGTGNHSAVVATQVRYAPQAAAKAQLVQSFLGGVGQLVADPSLVQTDVVLVLGRDFRGILAPSAAPPPAAGPTTTTKAKGPKRHLKAWEIPEQACN